MIKVPNYIVGFVERIHGSDCESLVLNVFPIGQRNLRDYSICLRKILHCITEPELRPMFPLCDEVRKLWHWFILWARIKEATIVYRFSLIWLPSSGTHSLLECWNRKKLDKHLRGLWQFANVKVNYCWNWQFWLPLSNLFSEQRYRWKCVGEMLN